MTQKRTKSGEKVQNRASPASPFTVYNGSAKVMRVCNLYTHQLFVECQLSQKIETATNTLPQYHGHLPFYTYLTEQWATLSFDLTLNFATY